MKLILFIILKWPTLAQKLYPNGYEITILLQDSLLVIITIYSVCLFYAQKERRNLLKEKGTFTFRPIWLCSYMRTPALGVIFFFLF